MCFSKYMILHYNDINQMYEVMNIIVNQLLEITVKIPKVKSISIPELSLARLSYLY